MFLILCSLAASCQITKVDSGFLITRGYAEFVAAKFDSLDAYKLAHKECVSKALKCDSLLYQSELFISDLKEQYNMQSDMLELKSQMLKSYQRTEYINVDMHKQLKQQTRLKKVWKITAISFISLSVASIIYIAI